MPLTQEEKDFIIQLGKRIIHLRKSNKMKQKELSDLLDMDDGSLRRIESGRTNPTTTTLLSIAKAFKISVSELMDISVISLEQKE